MKYLGLFLNDQLTWKHHIRETNKKIIKYYAGIFGKMRHLFPEECHNTLYNSFVFSRLNYGIEIYVNTEKKCFTPLNTSQNKLLCILQSKHRKSLVNDLYKSFGVLKLTDMPKYNLIILMHKLMHHPNKIPGAIKELFTQQSQIHSYNTRNKYDLHATHINTKTFGCRKLSFLCRKNCSNNHKKTEIFWQIQRIT